MSELNKYKKYVPFKVVSRNNVSLRIFLPRVDEMKLGTGEPRIRHFDTNYVSSSLRRSQRCFGLCAKPETLVLDMDFSGEWMCARCDYSDDDDDEGIRRRWACEGCGYAVCHSCFETPWLGCATEDEATHTGDRSVVLAAVAQNGHALQFASAALRGDPAVVAAACATAPDALAYAPEALRGDRRAVLSAVTANGDALAHASGQPRRRKTSCCACCLSPPLFANVSACAIPPLSLRSPEEEECLKLLHNLPNLPFLSPSSVFRRFWQRACAGTARWSWPRWHTAGPTRSPTLARPSAGTPRS